MSVVVVAFWLSVGCAVGNAAAGSRYHVSYIWLSDLASVRDYRRQVASVLGAGVARHLEVVARRGLFGLIYKPEVHRVGAVRLARRHTELLRHAGLGGAAPVPESPWRPVEVGSEPIRKASAQLPNAAMVRGRTRPEQDLEAEVEHFIKQQRRRGHLASDERTGWLVYDFSTGEKLVTINEDAQFQAASLIKPFLALAFFHRVKEGRFIYGPKSRRHMTRMIHWSNNASTNWIMRQLGGPGSVQRILGTQYPGIFQDTKIVEYIPPGGRSYRNKASVGDYGRFLRALWHEKIPGARKIRRLMSLPGRDRIHSGVSHIPKGTKVYNKTGSTARLCGDMGILIVKGPTGKRYPYAVIGVIEKRQRARNYTTWIRARGDIIREVSDLVYKGIAQHHNFAKAL